MFLLGVAHATTADDVYEDLFIPKGDSMTEYMGYRLTHSTAHARHHGGFKYLVGTRPIVSPPVDILYCRAIQRDEDVYSEPHVFKPERFLDGELREDVSVDSLAFGFGRYFYASCIHEIASLTLHARRICPGRYTADSSIWIAMASILSAFKITKARNERGEEIDFEPTFSHGVIW